jgi:hypothetical protein
MLQLDSIVSKNNPGSDLSKKCSFLMFLDVAPLDGNRRYEVSLFLLFESYACLCFVKVFEN